MMALAAPAGTLFDHAPLHILTTATLNRLQELYPAGQFELVASGPICSSRRLRKWLILLKTTGWADHGCWS
jgi:hypothetical protein